MKTTTMHMKEPKTPPYRGITALSIPGGAGSRVKCTNSKWSPNGLKSIYGWLFLFAWLITTSQISEVTDMNGKYVVTYKTYCVLEAPVYKNGDLVIRDGEREIQLRIKSYTVETVSNCP